MQRKVQERTITFVGLTMDHFLAEFYDNLFRMALDSVGNTLLSENQREAFLSFSPRTASLPERHEAPFHKR